MGDHEKSLAAAERQKARKGGRPHLRLGLAVRLGGGGDGRVDGPAPERRLGERRERRVGGDEDRALGAPARE